MLARPIFPRMRMIWGGLMASIGDKGRDHYLITKNLLQLILKLNEDISLEALSTIFMLAKVNPEVAQFVLLEGLDK